MRLIYSLISYHLIRFSYNGSQLWDSAFSLQAIVETGLGNQFKDTLQLGHQYLETSQVREDVANNERWYRHISKGIYSILLFPTSIHTLDGTLLPLEFTIIIIIIILITHE